MWRVWVSGVGVSTSKEAVWRANAKKKDVAWSFALVLLLLLFPPAVIVVKTFQRSSNLNECDVFRWQSVDVMLSFVCLSLHLPTGAIHRKSFS